MSPSIACLAASFSSGGHAKSGKPCARLIALCRIARRVISRMTLSVNDAAFFDTPISRMRALPPFERAREQRLQRVEDFFGRRELDRVQADVTRALDGHRDVVDERRARRRDAQA